MTLHFRLGAALAISLLTLATPAMAQEVNIYSYREQSLLQPLIDGFTAKTGIKVNVLTAADGLLERVRAEGELSPADVVLTVDIGNLVNAKDMGITQAITAPEFTAKVPEAYRDHDGQWTALSLRARVFFVSKDRVDPSLNTLSYDDIAKPEWKGRLCTRSGDHAYNIGLIAQRISVIGLDATRDWLTRVRDNLAFPPSGGGDREGPRAIFEGRCDLSITNTYYMGVMLNNEIEPEQKQWAAASRIVYPDFAGPGTQVNVSGAVIAKYAPNPEAANALIGYLLSEEAQKIYADTNYEFPVVPGVEVSDLTRSWGELNPSPVSLVELASHRAEAAMLVDELRFNEGAQN